jgi:hypothetical protein
MLARPLRRFGDALSLSSGDVMNPNCRPLACALAIALTSLAAWPAARSFAGTVPAAGPSDFTPDAAFAGSGATTLEFENGGYQWDQPLAAFETGDGGYWIAGYNRSLTGGSDQFAAARLLDDGSPDPAFGTDGTLRAPVAGVQILAVAMAGDRFYVAEAIAGDGADFAVDCIDATGAPCAGFGMAGSVRIGFDLGTLNNDDLASAIAVRDGAIYVVGNVATPPQGDALSNPAIGIVKLDAASGALDAAFGNVDGAPGRAVHQLDRVVDGGDYVASAGLAIVGAADAPRLLITGNAPTSTMGDAEGFVVAVDGRSGALDAGFGDGGVRYIALPPGETFAQVLPTALAVRSNGRILLAGDYWHDAGGMVDPELVIAELDAGGSLSTDFGEGGVFRSLPGYHVETVGVAERPGSGDVVAAFMTAGLYPEEYTDYQQALIQVDAHGRGVRALTAITFPANGVDTGARSRPSGVRVDARNRTLMFGWRNWQFQPQQGFLNRDMTAARFSAGDSIFANGFGGAYTD